MTLIIGYGSTLRCDDGIGYMIAEQLMDAQVSPFKSEVDVLARQQLTPDLADAVSRADLVIFIDACAQSAPGEVAVRDVTPKGENWGAFVHEMRPEVLLDCVKELYGKMPAAKLITIGGQSFEIGEGLSPIVQAAIPKVLALLCNLTAS